MAKQFSPNHAFTKATQQTSEQEALDAEAQHRALTKMLSGGANTASTAQAAATPAIPSVKPIAIAAPTAVPSMPAAPHLAAPASPAMPGAPTKGQFFPGIMSALRKPKIGI